MADPGPTTPAPDPTASGTSEPPPPARAPSKPAAKKASGGRGHAATGGRILAAGLAAGTGLGLIGVMSASARASAPTAAPEPVRRVVVVDRTVAPGTVPPAPTTEPTAPLPPPDTVPVPAPAPAAPVAVEPAPLPLPPPPDPQPAPPVTESQGS